MALKLIHTLLLCIVLSESAGLAKASSSDKMDSLILRMTALMNESQEDPDLHTKVRSVLQQVQSPNGRLECLQAALSKTGQKTRVRLLPLLGIAMLDCGVCSHLPPYNLKDSSASWNEYNYKVAEHLLEKKNRLLVLQAVDRKSGSSVPAAQRLAERILEHLLVVDKSEHRMAYQYMLAQCLFKEYEYERAIPVIKAYIANLDRDVNKIEPVTYRTQKLVFLDMEAYSRIRLRQWNEALRAVDEYLEMDLKNYRVYQRRAFINLYGLNDRQAATGDVRMYEAFCPDKSASRRKFDSVVGKARDVFSRSRGELLK